MASLTGRVGSLLLGADPFLYFICALNWREKKFTFKIQIKMKTAAGEPVVPAAVR